MPLKDLLRMQDEGFRAHKAILRLLTRVRGCETLLDIGCGDGRKTMLYADFLGIPPGKVNGVEAKEQYLRKGHLFAVSGIDLERDNFPLPDDYFDLVICNQVIEHLKNIFLPLNEAGRVLKPGGYLLIGIPNLAGLHNRLLLLLGRQPVCNHITGPHLRCFSHGPFMDFLALNTGFSLEASEGASLYPLPWPLNDWGARFFPSLSSSTFYLLRRNASPLKAWAMQEGADTLL